MGQDRDGTLASILCRHWRHPTSLLQILRDIQAQEKHVSRPRMAEISKYLGVPFSDVLGVVEFYSFLTTEPLGRFDLWLSDSITDQMAGNLKVAQIFSELLDLAVGSTRADGLVSLHMTSCTGLCDQGPAGLVNGAPLTQLDEHRAREIAAHILSEVPVEAWPKDWFLVEDTIHLKGKLLEEALQPGAALERAFLVESTGVLEILESSGLRGRGGAGFSTALKWRLCREGSDRLRASPSSSRYVILNADEGEPGTFKDRVLLRTRAHDVIEGMTLCAWVTGASEGLIYLRGEYAFLRQGLEDILSERRRMGLLGAGILGRTGFDFDIRIHLGAGSYVCGEESALIESLEGRRGIPRNRPPYPVTEGYLGQPTVVNNVETFLAAAMIVFHGGSWFSSVGTPSSPGTKILSISGDCQRPGLYEIPFGVKLRDILALAGAGDLLGVQVGGPSGTFVAPEELDRGIAFEDLSTGGSMMIFGAGRNLFNIVGNFTRFFAHESCGFCTPCRVGTSLMRNLFEKIRTGHATPHDLQDLEETARIVRSGSHCGLGQTSANPILSTLERFPELYHRQLKALRFEPGFDLDAALSVSRALTGRNDQSAHLDQGGEVRA